MVEGVLQFANVCCQFSRLKLEQYLITKSVDCNFRAFCLAPQSRNILGHLLFWDGSQMASRLATVLEKQMRQLYQQPPWSESSDNWYVFVYWQVEYYFLSEFHLIDVDPFRQYVLFPNTDHVKIFQRIVSFEFQSSYSCAYVRKVRVKFPWDLYWKNKTYKLKRSIATKSQTNPIPNQTLF